MQDLQRWITTVYTENDLDYCNASSNLAPNYLTLRRITFVIDITLLKVNNLQ